jgi:hypothetical protein
VNANTAQRRLRIDVALSLGLHVIAQAFCPSLILAWIMGCIGLLLTSVRWHRYKPHKANLVILPTFRMLTGGGIAGLVLSVGLAVWDTSSGADMSASVAIIVLALIILMNTGFAVSKEVNTLWVPPSSSESGTHTG